MRLRPGDKFYLPKDRDKYGCGLGGEVELRLEPCLCGGVNPRRVEFVVPEESGPPSRRSPLDVIEELAHAHYDHACHATIVIRDGREWPAEYANRLPTWACVAEQLVADGTLDELARYLATKELA